MNATMQMPLYIQNEPLLPRAAFIDGNENVNVQHPTQRAKVHVAIAMPRIPGDEEDEKVAWDTEQLLTTEDVTEEATENTEIENTQTKEEVIEPVVERELSIEDYQKVQTQL